MKNGIVVVAALGALIGGAVLLNGTKSIEDLRHARLVICSDDCDGGGIQKEDECICLTSETNVLSGEIVDVKDLPTEQRRRLIICCDAKDNKYATWLPESESIESNCLQIVDPTLQSGNSMHNFDLGHAENLNKFCCGHDTGSVIPGEWGQCPYCGYSCSSGKPSMEPTGCNAFCGGN